MDKRNEIVYYYVILSFFNEDKLSDKRYIYSIDEKLYETVKAGYHYNIKNDNDYTYRNAVVEVTGKIKSKEKLYTDKFDNELKTLSNFTKQNNAVEIKTLVQMTYVGEHWFAKWFSEEGGDYVENVKRTKNLLHYNGKFFNSISDVFQYYSKNNSKEREMTFSNTTTPTIGELRASFDLNSITQTGNFVTTTTSTTGIPYNNFNYIATPYTVSFDKDRKTVIEAGDVELNIGDLTINGKDCKLYLEKTQNDNERKGNAMNKIFGNLEFGKYEGNLIKMSMNGLAYHTSDNRYVVYDADKETLTDVSDFTVDMEGVIYLMPVAHKDVQVGDIVKNAKSFVIVTEVLENGSLTVIAPDTNEVKTILPVKNIFGFNFFTKVVSLISNNFFGKVDENNPFGNILPLMMMNNGEIDNSILFMMMAMQNGKFNTNNPMMLYFLMKDDNSKDMLPLLLMQNGNLFSV